MRVFLNADLGELEDEPVELYRVVTHANIACGGHAGDDASMRRALRLALDAGTQLVAHPSYPDHERFGRVSLTLTPSEIFATVRDQCAALARVALALGAALPAAIKPHGALYHDAASSNAIVDAIVDGARAGLGASELAYVGPPTDAALAWAKARGVRYLREGFADRRYVAPNRLAARTEPDAVIHDPSVAASQALVLAQRGDVDTICAHGDTPGALAIARAVRSALCRHDLLANARALVDAS